MSPFNTLYKKGIELVLFRKHLIDKNVSDILRLHQYATDFVKKPINIFDSASEQIAKKFAQAGMCTSWQRPYDMPHILFWNLRKTTGFPATTL